MPGRGVEPRLRDTATGELTVAATGHQATLYACGITPYDATHMGHAATFTAWDLLVRAWLDAGHDVIYTQNVTDVDDPLLERAERDGDDWRELALRETERYRRDMEALRLLPPTYLIGAVEALPFIDRFAERLAARGALYDLDGDVYFSRGTDARFGSLAGPGTASGLSVAQMTRLSGERGGDPGRPGKKDPLDALVWRAERPGEPAWDSRFGRGRPGWHVECAAIAAEFLGAAFDVQAGGSDLVFPHHELSASHARVACAPTHCSRHRGHRGHRGPGLRAGLRTRRHGRLPGREDVQVTGQPGLRQPPAGIRRRPDGDPPRAARAPLPLRLGMDGRRASRRPVPPNPLAHRHHPPTRHRPHPAACRPPTATCRPHPAASRPPTPPPAAPPPPPAVPTPPPAVPPPPSAQATSTSVAPAASGVPSADEVLQAVRERLADDLDAPGALAAIDAWADAVLAAPPGSATPDAISLIRDTADALLGVYL